MPLQEGNKLGPYEILALIGKGGMGEVYRARDTKLKRDVAVKVLPEAFARDPERMARFQREAEVLASLNHPNIAAIYGVEDRALVMELVEGESPKGPLPFDDACKVASQIATALEYAHDNGVIHRDLKPANVKVTPEGVVKLLDFGLAKAFLNQREASASPENSPTLTMGATEAGVILGTAAYMAPEQAKGKSVDKRADIWAFGVLLYELLTGQRLFKGDDAAETLAQVLTKEPDLDRVPAQVRPLLRRCLEKDPKKRLRDIGDAMPLVDNAVAPVTSAPSARRNFFWPAAAASLALLLAGLGAVHFRERPPEAKSVRFQISAPAGNSFSDYLALSPDGRQLAFTVAEKDGRTRLWVRSLDTLEARPLSGTENGASPQWSPDGHYIAFGDGPNLKKIDTAGGPPQTICTVQGIAGRGSWNQDDVIIFGNRGNNPGIFRVSSVGGTCVLISRTDPKRGETFHAHPVFLPDGKHFLYERSSSVPENVGIYVGSVDAKPEEQPLKRIVATTFGPGYAPSAKAGKGHLLFLREGTLMTQVFDEAKLDVVGEAVPVAENVGAFGSSPYFTVSPADVLAYRNGGSGLIQLTWFDRQGKNLGPAGEPSLLSEGVLSPDGGRIAASGVKDGNQDIWLMDLARSANTRLTFAPGVDVAPVWSPDGSRVAYASAGKSSFEIHERLANGTGEERTILAADQDLFPQAWSKDGRYLLYAARSTNIELMVLPMEGDRKPFAFAPSMFITLQGRFSPDGRWVAYVSNESGRAEVYVQPFPSNRDGGGKWMVSSTGGVQPLWRLDGKELFYLSPNNQAMAVAVESGPGFKAGIPKFLFSAQALTNLGVNNLLRAWEVTPDGQKFLISTSQGATNSSPMTVVINWQAGLKK